MARMELLTAENVFVNEKVLKQVWSGALHSRVVVGGVVAQLTIDSCSLPTADTEFQTSADVNSSEVSTSLPPPNMQGVLWSTTLLHSTCKRILWNLSC